MLAQLQNLQNENYGFMVIGQSGWDDEELYNRAIRGEDISGVIGLGDLQNLSHKKKKASKKAKKPAKKVVKKPAPVKKAPAKTPPKKKPAPQPNPAPKRPATPPKKPAAPAPQPKQDSGTNIDYYHSDGKTSFTGNRNTVTKIKDVDMGSGSITTFGLMNLANTHDGPTCEGSYFKLGDVNNHNVMVFAPTGKNCVVAGDVAAEAGSMTIFKGLLNLM